MTEHAIAVAAVAISLIALFVSLWSLWIQRTHNRKSVRPLGHVQLSDSLQELHVQIVNKGCGPMFIDKFIAKRMDLVQNNIVYHLPNNALDEFEHQYHTAPEGYWLMPGDELMLIRLKGDHTDTDFVKVRENVRAILSEIVVNLSFRDIYDQKHPVFYKSLSWFKRKL